MVAWDIRRQCRVSLPWTEWKRHKKKAFTTGQVAEILGRHHVRVRNWLINEKIPRPFAIQDIDGLSRDHIRNKGPRTTKVNYLWTEEDIRRARDYMESTGRKDCPSESEVMALIDDDALIQYIRGEDGNFYPLWRAT